MKKFLGALLALLILASPAQAAVTILDSDGTNLGAVEYFKIAAGATASVSGNVVTYTAAAGAAAITSGTIAGVTINSSSVGATTPSSGAFTTLSATGATTLGDAFADVVAVTGKVTQAFTPGADSATTNKAIALTMTAPVDTTGTNTHNGLDIATTIGNATGGTNTVNGINFANTAGDAQVITNAIKIGTSDGVGTTTAINIGTGWDQAFTIGAISGYPALEQNATVSKKLFIASDTVASGQTAKTTTVTGLTAAAKCVATGNEVPSNTCYIKSAAPGSGSVVVTVNTDPGASNLDYTLVCYE